MSLTQRNMSRQAGRTLMVLSIGGLALIAFYIAWVEGAFEATGLFGVPFTLLQRLVAWFNVLVAAGLAIAAPLTLRDRAGRVVLAAAGLAAVGEAVFIWVEGWGDDMAIVPGLFIALGAGYWLNRRSNQRHDTHDIVNL